jgi:hypothetical protein
MTIIQRADIAVTAENLWFLERYLNVFDFANLFPKDAFGDEDTRGVPVTFKTEFGFAFETDIDRGKMQIRNRSKYKGWLRWSGMAALCAGDRVVIERVSEREYILRLERTT